jgi:hypothetical protein
MSTFNDRIFVEKLIAANGRYLDDPPVIKIVEYTNNWGGTCWGVIHQGQDPNMYQPSDYVHDPKTIFTKGGPNI